MHMNPNDMSATVAPAYRDITYSKALQLVLPNPPSLWYPHQCDQKLPPSWQRDYYIHEEAAPPYSPMDTDEDDWVSEPDVDPQTPQTIAVDNAMSGRFSQLTCLQIGLHFDNGQAHITALLKGLPRLTDFLLVVDRNPSSRKLLPDIRVYDEGDEPDDTDALDPPDILHDMCTALQSVQYGWRHRDAPLLCPELAHLGIIFPHGREPTSAVSLHALGSMMLFRLKEGCPLRTLTVEAAVGPSCASAAKDPAEDEEPASGGRPTEVEVEALPHASDSHIHVPPSALGWGLDELGELDGAPRAVVGVEDAIHNLVGCYLVERLRAPPPAEPWFRFADPGSRRRREGAGDDSDGEPDDFVPRSRVFPLGVETRVYRFVYPPSVGVRWNGRS